MDTGSYTFADLDSKYTGFFSPAASVLVQGNEPGSQYVIFETTVEGTINNRHVSTASFKVINKDNIGLEPKEYSILSAFPLMGTVEVKMGYNTTLGSVFKGYIFERILSIEKQSTPVLTVYCMDNKAQLRLNTGCQTHKDVKKWSDLVTTVLEKYSFSTDVTATPAFTKPMTLAQRGCTDFDFLCQIADKVGYEFFSAGDKLFFRKPMSIAGNLIKLGPDSIKELEHQTSLSAMISAMEYYGYNADTKEAAASKADTLLKKVGTGKTGIDLMGSHPATLADAVYMNSKSSRDLEAEGKIVLQKKSLSLVTLRLTTAGLPEMIPGRFLALEKMGDDLTNTYYIQSVKHEQVLNQYSTTMTCVSNTI